MKNNVINGVVIVLFTTLLGILIVIWNTPYEYVVCNCVCSNYEMSNDCYIVKQKIGDYLLGRD